MTEYAAASATVLSYKGVWPRIGAGVFLAPGARVIGDVEIGEASSIWFNCVLRGDVHRIRIGAGTNVQDGTVIHVTYEKYATVIGDNVTIGHKALLHGCVLEDGAFIGMQATVMDGCVVEGGAMVGAGALVTPGKRVPKRELWVGRPARCLRSLSEEELAERAWSSEHYRGLAAAYLEAGIGVPSRHD